MSSLFVGQITYLEKGLRTALVYLAIVVLLRVAGKRNLAQFNTFDLVVVLLLSNVVQNAIIGPDNSLIGGLFGAVVLILLNAGLVRMTARNERVARIVEGAPTTIARDGTYDLRALHHLALRQAEADESLHRQGVGSVADLEQAALDPNGSITFKLKQDAQPATHGEVQLLLSALARIEARLAPTP